MTNLFIEHDMNKIQTLAAVLIVKNEAENLHECLTFLSGLVDEIVILDSGSSDNSAEIAAKFNARFFVNEDWEGFGKQRQRAQAYVQSDWVLWIDADERVTPELHRSISAVMQNPDSNTIYSISRLSWFLGRFMHHGSWHPDWVLRLYPKELTNYDDALVHEKVLIPSATEIKKLDGDLLHFTYKDMEHYLIKSAKYARMWACQRFEKGKTASITQAVIHALSRFLKIYVIKCGLLDGKQGFLLAILSAYSTFVKYIMLWELNKKNNK